MTSMIDQKKSIAQQIRLACEELRSAGFSKDLSFNAILEVILWARWIPSSDGSLIGYFDSMRSLASTDEWSSIQEGIEARSGAPLPSTERLMRHGTQLLERLRANLLPAGRAVNSGNSLESKIVIQAMIDLRSGSRSSEWLGCSASMAAFWEALLASHSESPVACLFPTGATAAPVLGSDRSVILSPELGPLESWVLSLLSLYPTDASPLGVAEQSTWPLAIAAPPFGDKTRELLIEDRWLPPSPLDCPSAIRDSEARRVFAAHQRCSGTTYALMSAGIGFRTSKDLEYFREELVRRNWLDAVVELPAGSIGGAGVKGLLVVLRHDREANAPIQIVSGSALLTPGKRKSFDLEWDRDGITELAELLKDKSEGSCTILVKPSDLAANSFSFQASRYLHSDSDLMLWRYLDSRETVQLGDLAEIKRPVASLGRHEEDGIEVREVTPVDIDASGELHEGSKRIRVAEAALAKGRQQLLEPGDVLLSIKGGLGKVAVVHDLEEPTVPGQAFCVVRLRPNAPMTPVALVQYLRSAVGQTLLAKSAQGTAVAFVPIGEVKSLPIVIPNPSELQLAEALAQESVALSREVEALSRKLKGLWCKGWMEDLPPVLVTGDHEEVA